MPVNYMICQCFQGDMISAHRKILKRPDSDMTGGHTGKYCTGFALLANHMFS